MLTFSRSVMVCGSMGASGVGHLIQVTGIMRKKEQVEILENNLKASVRKVGLRRRIIFQQDNDPKQMSKLVKN